MSDGWRAVVFDLDDTLLDTSAVREARDRGDWRVVNERLSEVTVFAPAAGVVSPESVPAALRRAGVRVGILTRSPRWYAEHLLKRYSVHYDALVTGSDGYPPKPETASLAAIAQLLEVEVSAITFVGDNTHDHEAAAAVGALSVGVRWSGDPEPNWKRHWPDIAVADPDLLMALGLEPQASLGALADTTLAGVPTEWHWGTLLRPARSVYCAGRYFQPADVVRHAHHRPSRLLLQAKDDATQACLMGEVLATAASAQHWRAHPPELVVSVPPTHGEPDRFEVVRPPVAGSFGVGESAALHMVRPVDNYKSMEHGAREAANAERFVAHDAVAGKRVLLLDDVYTSGATARACASALRAAGAASVEVLAFALTQSPQAEPCPRCGGRLRVKDGRYGRFVGCGNWPQCKYGRDL
jgi:predicted amidophosphoribosyltransferase/FMN phosphatase YigB (HAD superfamily)